MNRPTLLLGAMGAFVLVLFAAPLLADPILAPGDFIIAIDPGPPGSASSYPDGEAPAYVVDGTLAKYLNFAGPRSGFIVTPSAASILQSFTLTTANDAEGRDPATWELFGTNDTITSLDNSTGTDENWILLDSGAVVLPSDRNTLGPVVSVTNGASYTSYKMLFPTLKSDPYMQIAEAAFYESTDGTGANVLAADNPILAIHQYLYDSSYPEAESPSNAIDGTLAKYLNFGRENSGFIVTPAAGPSVVRSFQITTANDWPERDPTTWELYGTDDAIASVDNSEGTDESWVLIDSGSVALPADREIAGPYVIVDNDTAYTSYKMIFSSLVDAEVTNSMQIAEIQFFDVAIPEPSTLALAGLVIGLIGLALRRFR